MKLIDKRIDANIDYIKITINDNIWPYLQDYWPVNLWNGNSINIRNSIYLVAYRNIRTNIYNNNVI